MGVVVMGVVVMPDNGPDEAVHMAVVGLQQLAEGNLVALPGAFQQVVLGGRLERGGGVHDRP